ncbi:MAG: ATP-binding protein, partial [Acidimicrobiales bacterium]
MVASAGLVGRSTVLDELVGLVERARSGGAQLVVVEGEAGIGKSILADALGDAAGRRGFRVLRAAADELGGRQSFGLIAGFLGARWLFEPAEVLDTRGEEPALPGYGPRRPGVELQASEAAIAAIEVLCAEGPVAIVLEDLHWADPSSLFVLRRLLRHVASLPLALVGTMRPAPCPEELAKLVGDLGAPGRKVLGPLDDVAVETLARERMGAAPGTRLQAQLSLAGGNPLFVLELLETLGLEGALHHQAGPEGAAPVVEVEHAEIPPSLLLTIVRHLSFLPSDTLRLLSVAAVLGVGFSPAHLAAVTGRPIVELLVSLGDAMTAGLLKEDGEDLSFRHELLREALYMDLPLGVRSALHRDAARELVRLGVPAGLLAEHALRGAERGDDDAVRLLHDAARQLAAEAPGTAVDLIG